MTRLRRKKPARGRPPRDPSGATSPLTVRLAPSVHAAATASAHTRGLPLATWAARELESASASTRPRFGTLEEVLRYVTSVPEGPVREKLLADLAPALLYNWLLLRSAIAAAWVSGWGLADRIRAACEEHAKGRP
jgi:hypothetical protein